MLCYLRQTIIHAWERSLFPSPGVVHLNLPFREPLAPVLRTDADAVRSQFDYQKFFAVITPPTFSFSNRVEEHLNLIEQWQSCQQGIIIAGVAHSYYPKEYCQAIACLSQILQYPVLAEALSPVRNYAEINPYLICTYDLILRNPYKAEKFKPDVVIQIGELPTSKELRTWLDTTQPQRWIIDPSSENLDALHGQTIHLRTSIEQLIDIIFQKSRHTIPSSPLSKGRQPLRGVPPSKATAVGEGGIISTITFEQWYDSFNLGATSPNSQYLQSWCETEEKVRQNIDKTMELIDILLEGKVVWLLSQFLPEATPIFIANSMPVRNAEFFWKANDYKIIPYFNRGANGIDGTLSTALGIAYKNQSSIILTGDLALLHDNNGFLLSKNFRGHLTIILINNQGGGIFEMLPIAKLETYFEEFFATPQEVDFSKLCLAYGIEHYLITNWKQFKHLLNPLPKTGIRVLELNTNRKLDAEWLKNNLSKFAL